MDELKSVDYWQEWLSNAIAKETLQPRETITPEKPFVSYALDSLVTVTIAVDLEQAWGRPVDPTIFWEFPNIQSVAAWIVTQ